jgi:formate hydrogenlyase subunit 3/multisubunit Na+/H+ antiporter MnhD subunit
LDGDRVKEAEVDMLAVTLNPGFALLVGAVASLALPKGVRAAAMSFSALVALWLLLDHEFGAAAAVAQMGLPVRLLVLDSLNRIFGITLLLALIIAAIASNSRQNRFEDAAILFTYGGAVSALFVGDFVSFVAMMSLSGLAGAWVIFCSPVDGSNRAGGRALIWRGLEGLLFLVGLAFHLAASEARSEFVSLDVTTIGGCFIFAALLIRVGAPLAHTWVVDAAAFASPVGAVALAAVGQRIGLYALARFFLTEPALMGIGIALMAVGLVYVASEDDLRRAGAYAFQVLTGLFLLLIGIGSPLAMAAVAGGAFSAALAAMAWQAQLGGVVSARGGARRSDLYGLAVAMPLAPLTMLAAGLAFAAAPGFAGFATYAVALDALASQHVAIRILAHAAPGVLLACLAVAPALVAFRAVAGKQARVQTSFSLVLAASLSLFFSLTVGLAPSWLYNLMPSQFSYAPYALDRLGSALQVSGAAALCVTCLYAMGLWPKPSAQTLLDVDALYRGPVSATARWLGVVSLRLYGAGQDFLAALSSASAGHVLRWVRMLDRPYARISPALQLTAMALVLSLALWLR